jgi:hypothetical protein
MWDITKLYITTCSNSAQLVPLHPIVISILFQNYKELIEIISEVEEIEEAKANKSSHTHLILAQLLPFPGLMCCPRLLYSSLLARS